jgi:hypothetical protein
LTTDVEELVKGMEIARREFDAKKDTRDPPLVLKDFLVNTEDKLKKLYSEAKVAQVSEIMI